MEKFFKENSYSTASDKKRSLGDRLVLGQSCWFYFRCFYHIYQCSVPARSGTLSPEEFHKASRAVFTLIEDCGGKFDVKGMEHLTRSEPIVFIGNHMSLVETMILPLIIIDQHKKNVTFVIKKNLLSYPAFGQIMRAIKAITVGRDNPRDDFKQVITEGKKILAEGKQSIIIFPQSTRSRDFNPENFNTIGIKLAKNAKVPVIPFALKTDFIGNGKFLKDLGPIDRKKTLHIHFGPPMEISGSGKEEHNHIVEFIGNKIKEWKEMENEKT